MFTFKKKPRKVTFHSGGMCVSHSIPVADCDSVFVGEAIKLVPVRDAFPSENDLPAENFDLENQLKSGIPLKEVESKVLGSRSKASEYLEKELLKDDSPQNEEYEDVKPE